MLDVDLLRDPGLVAKASSIPVVYIYRSGALRVQMKDALRGTAERLGAGLQSCTPEEVGSQAQPNTIFPSFRYCDWPTNARNSQQRETVDKVLHVLRSRHLKHLAIFTPHDGALVQDRRWPSVRSHCLVVEEADVSKKTLNSYLSYFDEETDLAAPGTILAQESFQAYFADVRQGAVTSVAELMHRFDEILLTQKLNNEIVIGLPDVEMGPSSSNLQLLRLLRGLVLERDTARLIGLQSFLVQRRLQGRSTTRRLVEVYSRTADLLWKPGQGRGARNVPSSHRELVWGAIMLAWEEKLVSSAPSGRRVPDLFNVYLDQAARDFLRRVELGAADPLTGLWPLIGRAVHKVPEEHSKGLQRARLRLIEAMAASARRLMPSAPWIGRIAELEGAAVLVSKQNTDGMVILPARAESSRSKWNVEVPTLHSFHELIGQERVISSLRVLVRRNRTRGVILYGPNGAGKATIATILARSLLCDSPGVHESVCGKCKSCSAGHLGTTFYDLRTLDENDFKRICLDEPRTANLLGKRVIILDHVDALKSYQFDRLLKTLEEPATPTSFVLLSEKIDRIRRAGQSRCLTLRVHPLARSESLKLTQTLVALNNLSLDEATTNIVQAVAQDLPGRVVELLGCISEAKPQSCSDLKKALDLDWPSDIMTRWRDIIRTGSPLNTLLGAPIVLNNLFGCNVASENMRLFLLNFHFRVLHNGGKSIPYDPAMSLVSDHDWLLLAEAWRARLQSQGEDGLSTWQHLANLAASDDHHLP